MRRTLTSIMLTGLVSGALLAAATLALEAWHWQQYSEAHALQALGATADAVVVENPYQIEEESLLTYLFGFVVCSAATTFWTVFVVIPTLLAARHVFSGAVASQVVAAAVVCTVSGIAFAFMQGRTPYVSPIIAFGAGGAIGLLSVLLLARTLPPDTSLERTREG
jgi:hypothetical protein